MLAGLRPAELSAAELMDAEWAALVELTGPGEHVEELWSEVTGDDEVVFTGAVHGDDDETARAVASLDDEQLALWVPAFAKALERGDPDEIAQLRKYWARTAKFAGGQRDLAAWAKEMPQKGKPAPKTPADTRQDSASSPVAAPIPGGFGMPPGMDDD